MRFWGVWVLGSVTGCAAANPAFDGDGADETTWDTVVTTGTGATHGSTTSATWMDDETTSSGAGPTSSTTTAGETSNRTTGWAMTETGWETGWTATQSADSTRGPWTTTTEGADATAEDTTGSTEAGATETAGATESGSSGSTGDPSEGSGSSSTGGCVAVAWYVDEDEDGYGGDRFVEACEAPTDDSGPYVRQGGDCDDDDDQIFPGAAEICGDDSDNDCDGGTDDLPECETCSETEDDDLLLCDAASWDVSMVQCSAFGGTLAVVVTDSDEERLASVLEDLEVDAAWIGLSRATLNDFVWIDGSLPEYVNWLVPVELGPRQCVTLEEDEDLWGWLPHDCGELFPALCEVSD